MSLEEIIADLEAKAAEGEHYYKHGSTGTSMREDMQYGAIAREQRRIIALLKQVQR